ncbi:unnamed protein product, partial [Prunus armeniaca]
RRTEGGADPDLPILRVGDGDHLELFGRLSLHHVVVPGVMGTFGPSLAVRQAWAGNSQRFGRPLRCRLGGRFLRG